MFRVFYQHYSRSFAKPLKTAHRVWSVREGIIVALIDEQGRVGLGEIAPLPWFGSESIEQAIGFLEGLGGEIEDWRDVPDLLPCCQFAFEMAGSPPAPNSGGAEPKILFQSPPELGDLGGENVGNVAGLLPAGAAALAEWEDLYATGTRSFKWKIGTGLIADELEIFRQLCDRLPDDALLRLDANGGLNFNEARQWLMECDRQSCVEFLEQPLGVECFDELLTLSDEFSTLIALDESIATYAQLEACYDRGWRDIFVVKPSIAGYPSQLRKFCQIHSIDVVFSSVFESSIGFQNALRVAQEIGFSRALGFGTARYFEGIEPVENIGILEAEPGQFLVKFWSAIASNQNIYFGNPNWTPSEMIEFNSYVGCVKRSNASTRRPNNNPIAQKIHIPTSGTTGTLKFATHTLQTLTNSVQATQHHFQTDRINSLCTLPMHHVSGFMQHLRSHLTQGQLILWNWKDLESGKFPDVNLSDYFLSLVPTQLQRLLKYPKLNQFKVILLGGAPAWASLIEQARNQNLPIALTYGMTETASQIATLKPEEFRSGITAAGRPLPHTQIEIRDDRNQPCPPNQPGELHITTTSRMLGYSPNLDPDPIFKPDDLGYLDPDGYLHIIGRTSDKIITGGENVYPAEIEAAIRATGKVQDVCVLGVADEQWGQIIVAVYVSDPPQPPLERGEPEFQEPEFQEPTPTPLNTFKVPLPTGDFGGSLPGYKRPKHWIAVAQLPRNAQGKIDRTALHHLIQDQLP